MLPRNLVTLQGEIEHDGTGYKINEDGDVEMRVSVHGLQKGDVIVSTSIEFGVLKSAVIVRPFKNCKIRPYKLT